MKSPASFWSVSPGAMTLLSDANAEAQINKTGREIKCAK
jgi:hypothetical protein